MFDIKNLAIVRRTDELVPMDEWDGECWATMFDFLAQVAPNEDPWDLLAAFIKLTLMKGEADG